MITILLKVAEIREETSDTVTLCLKQPGLKKIKYLPGQYLTLIFRINGRKYIRPYSFSSAPGIDSYLEVTIKRVLGGVVSNHINDQVKIDDQVEVMLPVMGDFIFDTNQYPSHTHVILWGVGSGITPLFSIAKYLLGQKNGYKVTLIYGNRNHDTVIFADKIKQLQKENGDFFHVWHFHTKLTVAEEQPFLIQGRISPAKVLAVMKEEASFTNSSIHYICGPSGLKESVKEQLFTLNVPAENIFTEDFELIKDPKDFENISTQLVDVFFENALKKVEVIKGKSILEASLDAFIDLPYSCQTGNCIACKGKLIKGKVKMIGITKRPEKLLDDECLLCCSYPLTDDVYLSV